METLPRVLCGRAADAAVAGDAEAQRGISPCASFGTKADARPRVDVACMLGPCINQSEDSRWYRSTPENYLPMLIAAHKRAGPRSISASSALE